MVSVSSLEQVHVQSGSFAGKVTDPLQKSIRITEIWNTAVQSVDEVPVENENLLVESVLTWLELPMRVRCEGVPLPDPGQSPVIDCRPESVRVRLEEHPVGDSVQLADVRYSLTVERQAPVCFLPGFEILERPHWWGQQ